ncbi:hypothetical protein SO802_017901 [Lithocarpus litseifolius]|uniref:Uncharacterized protein n=1 Tax=Lithocarpus litseifolius TaxID=425828 RepID=A0AAW2CLC4_9ROSI
MVDAVRQMVEKALEEEAKARERERKVRVICVKAKEKAMIAQEKERMCKIALILSCLFFVIVMLLLCFGSAKWQISCCKTKQVAEKVVEKQAEKEVVRWSKK